MLPFRIASSCCLLAILIVSTVPLSFSLSGSSTMEVQVTNKTIGASQLSLGFQPDWDRWQLFVQSSSLKGLAQDANFKLIRVFDFRQTNPPLMPCTYWNESSGTGTWNWTNVDDLVEAIFAVGAEPLFCLGSASSPVQRSSSIPRGMAVNPNTGLPYPGSYASYAREWVRHFETSGFPVRYYEIINEPDAYFGASLEKLQNYIDLWNTVARAMRSENPNVLLSQCDITMKMVLDYWLIYGDNVDYLDFHKYDASQVGQYSDAQMFYLAEEAGFESYGGSYGVDDARQEWFDARGKWLPVIDSESNFDWAWQNGTDPRIQQMSGAVWLALVLRESILKGLSYSVYYELGSSANWESSKPSGGLGFGMINTDTNKPWYAYYVQQMIGQNLAVNDTLIDTVNSSEDLRTLAWLHNGELIILLVCKTEDSRSIILQGVTGLVNYSRIDNTTPWQTPKMQAGTLSSSDSIDMNGYTVMLLQASISEPRPLAEPAFRDGFESGGFGAWNGSYVTPGETATVTNASSFQGSYSAKFASNGTGGFEGAYCYESVPASSGLYAGGYFYVSQSGIAGNDDCFYLIEFLAGGNDVAYAGWLRTGGVDTWTLLIRNAIGWASAYSNFSPSLDKWHSVELYWAEGAADGYGELYVDDALACSIQNQNTTAFGGINEVRLGLAEVYSSGPTTVYADSCRILSTPPWDINQDGTINMLDIAILAAAFGSKPGSSNWNPATDINADGKVDMRDLAILASHYGERYS